MPSRFVRAPCLFAVPAQVRQQLVPKVVACSMAMLMSRHERVRAEAETFLSDIRIVPGADLVLVRHLARALVHFLSAVPDTGDTERDREAAAEPPPGVEESSESSLSRSADARIEEEGHRDGPYPTTEGTICRRDTSVSHHEVAVVSRRLLRPEMCPSVM